MERRVIAVAAIKTANTPILMAIIIAAVIPINMVNLPLYATSAVFLLLACTV